MSDAIVYRRAAGDRELEQILALQARNVEEALRPDEVAAEGFVTVRHDLDLLRDMNRAEAHVVALDGERVVGYALVMLPAFRERLPILEPMFERLARLEHRGRPVDACRIFVMGQVCVDREYRGRGVLDGMYGAMRALYSDRYDLVVTEVARRNARSRRAHARVGFELLERYRDPSGEEWDLIAWSWE